MKKKNLLWIALGAVALYIVFMPKKSKTVLQPGTKDSVDTKK